MLGMLWHWRVNSVYECMSVYQLVYMAWYVQGCQSAYQGQTYHIVASSDRIWQPDSTATKPQEC